MRFAPTLTLLSALAFAASAQATTVNFSITDTNTHDIFTFSFDPAAYGPNPRVFAYDVTALVDGYPESLALQFSDNSTSEDISIVESYYSYTFTFDPANGTLPLTGETSSGHPPTVTAGSYAGTVSSADCDASVTMPHIGLAQLPTLALFQQPIIILGCGDDLTLSVTTPNSPTSPTSTTVTPEPSTLALLGSGALGVFGIARRRSLS